MMVYFDVEASVATGAIVARHPAPVSRLACVPGHLSSLVLSADAGVRRRLEAATELAGWSICGSLGVTCHRPAVCCVRRESGSAGRQSKRGWSFCGVSRSFASVIRKICHCSDAACAA